MNLPIANSTVSIVKCESIHDSHRVKKSLEKALDLIGGIETFICRGDTVIVKPNLIKPAHYKTGTITNPFLVEAACRIVKEKGAKKVIVADGAAVGYDTEKAFDEAGLREITKKIDVELFDFKKAERIGVPVPYGRVLHRIKLPRVFLEADIVINIPVMKTHDVFPATLGIKNIKGVIREEDKKRFHKWGLSRAIVDLNKVAFPDLTIVDGTVGMEGLGPTHGEPVNLGVIVVSRDVVAADTVASTIMGIDPSEIEYIKLAEKEGLGCADLSRIEVVGERLENLIRPFKRVKLDFKKYEDKGIFIHERGACSGCRHNMESIITSLEKKGELEYLKGFHIVFGQLSKMPERVRGKLVFIGLCTREYKNKGYYIPGCPPHPEDIMNELKKIK
ncbi:DUF362 domain-containing protein [Candidatus Aerophobetes bacterium]|nr:DUF362 domain-containing protein [Candidatus Aerophobetes bacterium]